MKFVDFTLGQVYSYKLEKYVYIGYLNAFYTETCILNDKCLNVIIKMMEWYHWVSVLIQYLSCGRVKRIIMTTGFYLKAY